MFKNNNDKNKKIILAYSNTRRMYKLIKFLIVFLLLFMCGITIFNNWYNFDLTEKKNNFFGEWDIVFCDINENKVSYFKNHSFINKYAVQIIQDRVILGNGKKVYIGTCDNNFFLIGHIQILRGRLPINDREVAVEEEYLSELGVKNIGDIIPKGENANNISGYRVCGIIQNYSSRWKMANSNINFINLFIKKVEKKEQINIFISTFDSVKKDLKINYINYYENVNINQNIIKFESLIICGTILLILIIIVLSTKIMIKNNLNNHNNFLEKDIINKKKTILINVLLIFFKICCLYLFLNIVDSIVLNNYYYNNYHISFINEGTLENKIISNYEENLFYIEKIDQNVELKYYPYKEFESLLTFIIKISWLLLVNWLIICLILYKNDYYLKTSNKLWLNYYFFNNYYKKTKQVKKFVFTIFIENILVIILFFYQKKDLLWNMDILIIALLLVIFNCFRIIINKLIIIYSFRHINNSTNYN